MTSSPPSEPDPATVNRDRNLEPHAATGEGAPHDDLSRALAAAATTPARPEAWDEVERLATEGQRPDEAARIYREVIARPLPRELVLELCERAVGYLSEWFDDSEDIAAVLARALEVDPTAAWAFGRLTMRLTVDRRWDDLFVLYDRALDATDDRARRINLFTEAAQVAKDLAGRPDRAIAYLEALDRLSPLGVQAAAALERLLERAGRHRELVTLWSARLERLEPRDARALRAQIAACLLEHLDSPAEALDAIDGLLDEPSSAASAIELLEKIFVFPTAKPEVRQRALAELRRHYTASSQVDEIIRVLVAALRAPGSAPAELHREIAELLVARGRETEAIDHYAELVSLDPEARDAMVHLRDLSARGGRLDRYAGALTAAAEARERAASSAEGFAAAKLHGQAIELLFEAAVVHDRDLSDPAGATALYVRIFHVEGVEPARMLDVCRRLDALLAGAPERLAVLARRASLEPDASTRRTLRAEAARLEEDGGATTGALATWELVLSENPFDGEAHDAKVRLLEGAGRWEELIDALQHAAAIPRDPEEQRALQVRAANVYGERLRAVDAAIATWREIESLFGANTETIDALAALLDGAARWQELCEVLERGIGATEPKEGGRRCALLQRLGDVYRTRVGEPVRALDRYESVLAEKPAHPGARAGLTELLGDPRCRARAIDLLLHAYETMGDWAGRLSLLEHRLDEAGDDTARTSLLREAADLAEHCADDPSAALCLLARALPLAPDDSAIELDVLRLADAANGWDIAATSLAGAVAASGTGPRAAELHHRRGTILETKLADPSGALSAYRAALDLAPARVDIADATIRAATRARQWDVAAHALVASTAAHAALDPDLVSGLEEAAAAEEGAWDALATALAAAVAREPTLSAALASELEQRIAIWHRDRRGDAGAAEEALLRALGHAGSSIDTLRMLADVQRAAPGRPLVVTLLRLADANEGVLAALHEAARVSADIVHDDVLARPVVERLMAEVASRLGTGAPSEGWDLGELSSFALRELVRIAVAQGDHVRAIASLVSAAELPLGPDAARDRLHEAAALAELHVADVDRAISLYRAILATTPSDERAITRLAALLARDERWDDLLALRQHELALASSTEARVRLRLSIAELQRNAGQAAATVGTLRANLDDSPGHEASLEELATLLAAGAQHAELVELFERQAEALEASGDGARAAGLWTRASEGAEHHLADLGRALSARTRAAAFAVDAETFDALARLCAARNEHEAAVGWLERRLDALDASKVSERVATLLRLADMHGAAGHPERSLESLEEGLRAHPGAAALRERLGTLYRSSRSWDRLVDLLTDTAELPTLEDLREAADLCVTRLASPERAITILDAVIALAPTDRPARLSLAGALRATGDVDRARLVLTTLLDEYGRRRPPERADVHFQLALVAAAAGDGDGAQAQLEAAIAVNPQHPGALQKLGRIYRDAGALEKAERVYGALLLMAMRHQAPSSDAESLDRPARSEVMLNLHWLLTRLGQTSRADEMLVSAFDVARSSEFEARRLQRAIREAGDDALLLRALEAQLAQNDLDGPTRAKVLADMADLLGGPLDRPDEALAALLGALDFDPSSSALHDRASAMARRAGASVVARYAETLAALAEKAATEGTPALAAALFFRLGMLIERDLEDPARALAMYARAADSHEEVARISAPPAAPRTRGSIPPASLRARGSVPPTDDGAEPLSTWRAIDRVAGVVSDVSARLRALRHIVFAADASDPATHAEDVYRLAELELGSNAELTAGLATLEWAVSRDPQYERAGRMLRHAVEQSADADVLAAYERLARASGDRGMLLDALERASATESAGMEIVREAVDLAAEAGEPARIEPLLLRAVAMGESSAGGLGEAVWALVGLADRSEADGDPAATFQYLSRAITAAEHDYALELTRRSVAIAIDALGKPSLAAEAYEQLLERDRHDREVWQPLLDIYRRLGDREVFEAKLGDAVECAFDATFRSDLRMERAKLLFDWRPDDAAVELEALLREHEDYEDAAAMLTRLYEQRGSTDALAEIVERRLDLARTRADAAAILELSLKLGELWATERPADAIDIYRSAAEQLPESSTLLERLLALYSSDDQIEQRADVTERLVALAKGDEAVERALALAALRSSLDDEEGMVRALEMGFRESPGNAEIREQLAAFYTTHQRWAPLAEMRAFEGSASVGAEAVAHLREAAAIYLEHLDMPHEAAAVLGLAAAHAPEDTALLVDYARCLAKDGEGETAVAKLTEALDRGVAESASHVTLLQLRAELHSAAGQLDRASADLEAAYRLDSAVAPELAACLERRRATPAGQGDRALMLRLVDVLLAMVEDDRAREVLMDCIERDPNDTIVLRKAAEIEGAGGRWESAAEVLERLVALEQGPARIEAALLYADACRQAGTPGGARPALESILEQIPAELRIREKLRRVYEETSAHRELANLYLAEAGATADPGERFTALRRAGTLLLESVDDSVGATAALEAAHELRPRDTEGIVALADAYIKTGHLTEATQLVDGAITAQKGRRSRDVSMMQQRMAKIARSVGDRANELAWLNAAFDSDAQNGDLASLLAEVATELGQLDVAIKALKGITLMRAVPPRTRAMAYLRQALIAEHQGDLRRAVHLAKKAEAEDPQLEMATALLSRLSGG